MKCANSSEKTILGYVASTYGVKGWVKIYSYTDQLENILNYSPWLLNIRGEWISTQVEAGKRHGKGLVAKLVGVDSLEVASTYNGVQIAVYQSALPVLGEDDFYWSQLENLHVYTESNQLLGKVDRLLETGANDVLVVKGNVESIDQEEQLAIS